jgi:ABC-type amino acid transport substrate-binding protein
MVQLPENEKGAAMRALRRLAWLGVASFVLLGAGAAAAVETLDRIRDSGAIRIGYRADAPPFSSSTDGGEPRGYSIDICKKVVEALRASLRRPDLATEYVLVTAADRFDMIEAGAVDLLCEPTTVTMGRRERVDFSLLTFISGAGLAVRADGTRRMLGPGGPRVIGVLTGTTTERQLRTFLDERGLDNPVVPADTHEIGLSMLLDRQIDGYFADRELLLRLAANRAGPPLLVSGQYLSVEPYALAMPRGADKFRLAVDREIARLYRSGEIERIFAWWFPGAEASEILRTLYFLQAIPE